MAFKPVYYSQQDPQWKNEILGFGDPTDTIGYVGCALTSVAMLISGHGYVESPKTLNQKLKDVQGFASAGIRWGAVSQIHPQVSLKSFIPCADSPAPLDQIDSSLAAGQPAIVMVDSSPAAGLQTHWVVLYGRKGDDYLMLDPWPYSPGTTSEDYLMPRYSRGNPLKRSIMHVILYECYTSGEPVATPFQPESVPGGAHAKVKDDVTWGLNIRSSTDTSSMANVVVTVPAGTQLQILDSDGQAKIGAINQWVRVRDGQGHEGLAAAWYMEKVGGTSPTSSTGPAPASSAPQPVEQQISLFVAQSVGTAGLRMRKGPSKGSAVVAMEPAGARLSVLDAADKARKKIGKANQWILVRDDQKRRGYVEGQYIQLG